MPKMISLSGKPDPLCKVRIRPSNGWEFFVPEKIRNYDQIDFADADACVQVQGHYADPILQDNGIFLYKKTDEIKFNGTLAVLRLCGAHTVRYVVRRGKEVRLYPIQAGSKTLIFRLKEFKREVKVLGVVSWCVSSYGQPYMDKTDPFDSPKGSSPKVKMKRGRPRKMIEKLWKEAAENKEPKKRREEPESK